MAHARKPKAQAKKQQTVVSKSKRVKTETEAAPAPFPDDVQRLAHVQGQKIQVQTRNVTMQRNANRPSMFLPLGKDQDLFMEQFVKCWEEHIEGFGSVGKKRERTEVELGMEWRSRIKTKQEKISKAKAVVVPMRKSGQSVSEADRLLAIQKYRELQEKKKLPAQQQQLRVKHSAVKV